MCEGAFRHQRLLKIFAFQPHVHSYRMCIAPPVEALGFGETIRSPDSLQPRNPGHPTVEESLRHLEANSYHAPGTKQNSIGYFLERP